MSVSNLKPGTAIVTGASGQDGFFLTERLLREGWLVHAISRRPALLEFEDLSLTDLARLHVHDFDLGQPQPIFDLITATQPDEFYNLAGQSSVSKSFSEPLYTWRTNAEAVVHLLECIRLRSPLTRFYQASSTDMFGMSPSSPICYNEDSALNPQSPYASAKAAAHLLCRSYREVYSLRIACGILSNHESHRRPASFISRKVVDHVLKLKHLGKDDLKTFPPLVMGNLKSRRDWGFAPEYVEGMCRILRQASTRTARTGENLSRDIGSNYRDYVLGTGKTHAVWELVDRAFSLAGLELNWHLDGAEAQSWHATFQATGSPAVVVDPSLLRTAEPLAIEVDPSLAKHDLGWSPQSGLTVFLNDMLSNLDRVLVD